MQSLIDHFQLFLFDFDGLLVNSEHIHYQAYKNLLAERGFNLNWNFIKYCSIAHESSEALRQALYQAFPDLSGNWNDLYQRKKEIYLSLISSGKVELMPGVERLLTELDAKKIRRCVVTNSILPHIQLIRSQHKILQTIPNWITREDYEKAKPFPDGYLRAIELYGEKGDQIIGFEDTMRGIRALMQTPAQPVLICSSSHPLIATLVEDKVIHFESLELFQKAFGSLTS